jgi:hypothetical protein
VPGGGAAAGGNAHLTDEMLALAQRNARETGVANVHFLKGMRIAPQSAIIDGAGPFRRGADVPTLKAVTKQKGGEEVQESSSRGIPKL